LDDKTKNLQNKLGGCMSPFEDSQGIVKTWKRVEIEKGIII
jgi:hypothetical protein